MKVSGFTFAKNAIKYDYPLAESIRSILPIVDEFVVCLGDSEDETEDLIKGIESPKLKIIHSVWNKDLREGGRVLAEETDKSMDATAEDSNWLFYVQADEVVHEKDLPVIWSAMEKYKDDKKIEGLLFRYNHFYGSYKYIADGRKWYSKEIRVVRNDHQIRSYRDAQGFRKGGKKLKVKQVDAFIYHYGWLKNPSTMQRKLRDFGQHWNDEKTHQQMVREIEKKGSEFNYSEIDSLSLFEGTHPAVMKEKIEKANWEFNHNIKKKKFKNIKHQVLYFLQQSLNWRPFEYKNYHRI